MPFCDVNHIIMIGGNTGTLNLAGHGNQSGSVRSNNLSHAQRIGSETFKEYNLPKSHRQLTELKRYAELVGNYKN